METRWGCDLINKLKEKKKVSAFMSFGDRITKKEKKKSRNREGF